MITVLRETIRILLTEAEPTPKIAAKKQAMVGADEFAKRQKDDAASRIIKSLGWNLERELGKGANGIVYLAQNDEGRQIAIKLTTQEESDEYLRVKQVRNTISDDLKKHLPVVHFVEKLSGRPGGFVNAIGLELLEPLPKQVTGKLFKPAGASADAMQDVLRSEEIIIKILRAAAKNMSTSAAAKEAGRHTDLGKLLSNVESKVLQGKMPEGYSTDNLRKEVQIRGKDWADKEFSLKARKLAVMAGAWMGSFAEELKIPPMTARFLSTNMSLMVVQELQSTAMGIANPDDPDAPNWGPGIFTTLPGGEKIPGAESLGRALREMAKLGLSWRDLHDKNVMMRPGTRDIVVSDFGNFIVA